MRPSPTRFFLLKKIDYSYLLILVFTISVQRYNFFCNYASVRAFFLKKNAIYREFVHTERLLGACSQIVAQYAQMQGRQSRFQKKCPPLPICPAKYERIFGGHPLAGGPKIQQKSAPKDAFPIVHCALCIVNCLTRALRRTPVPSACRRSRKHAGPGSQQIRQIVNRNQFTLCPVMVYTLSFRMM